MDEKKAKFLEEANESIDCFDTRYAEGMTHEEQADFAAGTFRNLLLDAVEIISGTK